MLFELHETYQDAQGQQMAARYDLVEDSAEGPLCTPETEDGAEPKDSTAAEPELPALDSPRRQPAVVNRTYVHLLGPDTLRPALRGLQCPVPARRAAELQKFVRSDGSCTETNETVERLNLNES
ncbi:hypothetical protein [Hymenobacter coccineus]|uniref:Uncharacterized protein n=1 Tax=Hymenobacter coccineus TaxID=1908235 RepID=A0A1G1THB8_9BACT|nr:hypothetical protein [Hymenobacter coccineus]OGX90255.1 hypothetical protein BEN49_23380 [Hymenobacter coccineus]